MRHDPIVWAMAAIDPGQGVLLSAQGRARDEMKKNNCLPDRQSWGILKDMKNKRIKLSEQIRQAIDHCGVTRYVISKKTGIQQSALSRFMSGERGLPTKTLDKLADYLDLNISVGDNAPVRKGGE
jgi:predicted XRE-type DNA-binding protein